MTSIVRIPALANQATLKRTQKVPIYDVDTDTTFRMDVSTLLVPDEVVASVAGGTITLDFDSTKERRFKGGGTIGAPKTWQLSNDTVAVRIISLIFELTTLDVQTFPAAFKMADIRWDAGAKTWTPLDTGIYVATAIKYGGNWLMTINNQSGPFI